MKIGDILSKISLALVVPIASGAVALWQDIIVLKQEILVTKSELTRHERDIDGLRSITKSQTDLNAAVVDRLDIIIDRSKKRR